MKIIGIDPGLKGAIALLNEDGTVHDVIDTPTVVLAKGKKKKNIYDLATLKKISSVWEEDWIMYMEKMQSMPPGFRVQASFGLGYCQGLFEGIIISLGCKYELVISKTWQKHFGITGAKGNKKVQSYMIASKLFPQVELVTPRGRKLDGRSDALLIAEWGRRHMQGQIV